MLKTIKEYIPIDSTVGIFGSFKNPVWSVVLPDSAELDTYFNLRYGERIAAKKLDYWINSDGVIEGEKLQQLSDMIYNINANRWKHLFNAYMVEYNPIENTDYIETFHETSEGNKTVDSEKGNTETRNLASGNTKTVDTDTTTSGTAATDSSGSSSGSNSNANNVYGFNSNSAVGHDNSSGSDSNSTSAESDTTTSSTGTEDTTVTDSGTETGSITNAGTEDTSVNENNTHEYELRKHGNIGVTTNVTMLREDIDFWWKWSYVDYICQDICDFIALSIY